MDTKVKALPPCKNLPGGTSLRSSLAKFHLIHSPHSALDVLHAHEAFMQRQVVAHGVLQTVVFNNPLTFFPYKACG